jgi:hypothetical protein
LTCEKKVCICNELINNDWEQPLPSSSLPMLALSSLSALMPSSSSDFDCVTPSKTITTPITKTYAVVVATLINEQVKKIKKVYNEKMANLDKQLSQEVKRHQSEEKQMKYVITQLVNQKQELEEKLAKTAPSTTLLTKLTIVPKPTTSKPPVPTSSTLKKPSPASPKSNVKYIPLNHPKEALTLKSPFFIKFNQIQIEKIETKNFNTPTPRQGDKMQSEISKISNLEFNTPSLRANEIQITFPIPKLLPQAIFTASESLPQTPSVDSLLIKRKCLGLSKHKINTENTPAFIFDKPTSTDSPEYKGIEKLKKVSKKINP